MDFNGFSVDFQWIFSGFSLDLQWISIDFAHLRWLFMAQARPKLRKACCVHEASPEATPDTEAWGARKLLCDGFSSKRMERNRRNGHDLKEKSRKVAIF